ncbi:MAG: diacylglycerol kinase family lipid kinase [Bacteroides sp.]|nr:diacylglycerol kinase family lipid kinase [Bacteroides sp.]MCM1413219.1 diacylglycerol kinase family lipid kinase [Bacteroides sp.]MCM1471471.1 diacylglycerol kinase family lipid kinase [Bacteroides sp.]
MTQKRALLIINPISGTGKKKGLDEKVATYLRECDIAIDACWTKASGDATTLARKAVEEGYDMVIAAGGDGTINETAIALCGTGVTLGIIPCGSGNGLARHLNIPVDIDGSLKVIRQIRAEDIDYGMVNGRPFFCTFGVGFDAAVSHKFAMAKHRGKMTYIKKTFQEFVHFKPERYIIKANGEVITEQAFVVAVCNASQYGNNAYIAPNASITDGKLDITIIHYGNLLSTALVGIDLMAGTINKNFLIHTLRTDSLELVREAAGPAHIDGEPLILDKTLEIRCHNRQLRILTPASDTPIRPLLTPIMSMFNDIGYTVRNFLKKL